MIAVIRKELADYFNSVRFLVLFLLVLVAGGCGLYAAQQGIRTALEQSGAITSGGFVFLVLFTSSLGDIPILTMALAIVIPITGIILGFDAINSERSSGTMSRLLAQPVYRDSIINGKFLAGLITLSLMVGTVLLLIAGYGLRMIGVPPTAEEIIRLFLYGVLTVVYGAFWMGLATLFSVVFRRAAASLIVPMVLFLVFYLFWTYLGFGHTLANAVVPVDANADLGVQINQLAAQETIQRISPSYLFEEAYIMLLVPMWKGMGAITYNDLTFMLPNPLGLWQCLLSIWPHLIVLISLSVVCFGISYVVFMKQEIRAT